MAGFKILCTSSNSFANVKICCNLMEEIIEKILVSLPAHKICQFRSVCKGWNKLLSSPEFLSVWNEAAVSNRDPWLLVETSMGARRFCFSTWSWKKIVSGPFSNFASGAGLLLKLSTKKIIVFNPLTRTYVQLPPLFVVRTVMLGGIVGCNNDSYKVVVGGFNHDKELQFIEIFDPCTYSWKIAKHLPEGTQILYNNNVFFQDFFFFVVYSNPASEFGIMGFSIKEDCKLEISYPFVSLPETVQDPLHAKILSWRSSILMAADVGNETLAVWEWDFDKRWKQITQTPSWIRFRFNDCICVGVGDYICFKEQTSFVGGTIFAYDLAQTRWTYLPPGGDDKQSQSTPNSSLNYHLSMMALQPKFLVVD
ncbi:hypothetical protein KI387_028885 [Taxus chinensis]|uniref:F-box domain-containing protein n=1 Tax=Taxus chinensis TaxID=29808 RepID=A0AA38FCA5_TAXCH|nr:hypothetical protein KI387_028885 [Taxus chinensis]